MAAEVAATILFGVVVAGAFVDRRDIQRLAAVGLGQRPVVVEVLETTCFEVAGVQIAVAAAETRIDILVAEKVDTCLNKR